jgi:hypothetical protein
MKSTIKIIVSLVVLLFTGVNKVQSIGPVNISDVAWPNLSSSVNPTNYLPGGLALWWNSSDLSSSPVETWTDRVQGYNLKQTTAASKPTWSTNGVDFDGADDYFNGTNIIGGLYGTDTTKLGAWLVVFQTRDLASASQLILGNTGSGGDHFLRIDNSRICDGGSTCFDFTSTNFVDYFTVTTNYPPQEAGAYTNGVHAVNYGVGATFGGSGVVYVGIGSSFAVPFEGIIREMICWTNVIWTPTMISNVHKYVTLVHPVTP